MIRSEDGAETCILKGHVQMQKASTVRCLPGLADFLLGLGQVEAKEAKDKFGGSEGALQGPSVVLGCLHTMLEAPSACGEGPHLARGLAVHW